MPKVFEIGNKRGSEADLLRKLDLEQKQAKPGKAEKVTDTFASSVDNKAARYVASLSSQPEEKKDRALQLLKAFDAKEMEQDGFGIDLDGLERLTKMGVV